jgi:CheY-like chemotaxis protein
VRFRSEERHQALYVNIDEKIPKMLVADEQRLAQVITNFLSNAIKFSPEMGEIRVETTLVERRGADCVLQVEVSDTGIGINAEQQERLFQPFEQAKSDVSRKYGGTGLGLAISKRIVEMMDGEIWVQSKPGIGSVFGFRVKVAASEAEPPAPLNVQDVDWANLRLLVVDDAPDIREYFERILSKLGATCHTAADAKEAIRLIEQNGPYQLYFVDWIMPGMDGIELSRVIKEKAEGSIVIMVSATDWNNVKDRAREAGVDRFLQKPLFPSVIADCIGECLGAQDASGQVAPVSAKAMESFEGYSMLLVEDIEINREILLSLLEPTGLHIECAEDGVRALEMFGDSEEKWDIILMDVQMPIMDGLEATRRIRAMGHPRAKTVPIIAMTANVFREDVERCLEAGMNDHVGKPLYIDSVLKKLHEYMKK